MATPSDAGALGASRTVLRILLRLNPLVGLFILALLVTSLLAPEFLMRALGMGAEFGNASFMLGMRLVMILGIVAVVITHLVLIRLLAIVETVRVGDPFIVENAVRLQQIAWAVLSGEIVHLVIVVIAGYMSTAETPIDIRWKMSITRWLAVLLLFVLARVFETGARMRQDLEGTV
jgi:hypothetical protein